jgi:transposase
MAYSQDLRERVVRAVQRGDRTQKAIAEDFGVSLSFVEEVWRRQRETGRCAVKVWRR